ncbi:MAG: M20 family metallopeptidase [Acidilobus sp.]
MSKDLRQRLAELASDMIKIDTSNPPGDTRELADFIVDYLQINGYSSDTYQFEEGKVSVVSKVGKGSPVLILNGHMDVVPPGDRSRWSFDPFSGQITSDGRVLGRGATDMKGGLAVATAIYVDLAQLVEKEGLGTLIYAATADEEVGGAKGLGALVSEGVVSGDAAIITEPSGIDTISIGEKGICQVRLTAKGRSAHGSMPILGDNAILKAMDAIQLFSKAVKAINDRLSAEGELEDLLNRSVQTLFEEANKRRLKLSKAEAEYVLKKITFNPGVIRGGTKVNMVPDVCEVEIDMRVPISMASRGGQSPCSKIVSEAYELIKIDLGKEDAVKDFEIEVINESEPNYTSPSESIVKLVSDSVKEVLGIEPRLRIETGATDGRYLRAKGIPTVIYGPGEPFLAHAYDEYVKVEDLLTSYSVLSRAVTKFFNIPSEAHKLK